MAINFLNKVDFNQNELDKARIVNEVNDTAAGTPVDGQLYYDTTLNVIKVGEGGLWVSISGDITGLIAGTYINIDNAGGPIPTINHDLTTRTDTASALSGVVFPVVDSITTNTTGHVTAVNIKTVTVPDVTTYDLTTAPTGTAVRLTGNLTGVDDVTISGFSGQTLMSRISASELRVALTPSVVIANDITLTNGTLKQLTGTIANSITTGLNMNTSKLIDVGAGTIATDGVNLGQVEALVAGIGLFKGGYNATTGLTVNLGAGNGSLDGTANIALDQGDFFVVTVDGTAFFTLTLEVGDMIYVNKIGGITANSNPPVGDYTLVIQDANIAGSGATDAATEKGVAGFDSASFDVSVNGWVQLNSQRNPYGAVQSLNNTSPVTRTVSGGLTTFTIDLANATLFGAGTLAKNVTAEVTGDSAPFQTVYADVTRSGTASMSVVFSGTVAVDIYRVLLTHV